MMKCVHPHTFEKLGFDEILAYLDNQVKSEEAKAEIPLIRPEKSSERILAELYKVREFKDILEFGDPFPSLRIGAISPILARLEIEGNWLNRQDLHAFLSWLVIIREVTHYLRQRSEKYPHLHQMVNQQAFDSGLIKKIEEVLDERGNIRDNASPELAQIRRQLISTANDLRNTLYKVLRMANEQNWSQEKEITIRNDRLVIPVKAEAKNQVAGFVQDVSQTGGTVYIEPAEALPLNNRMRELQFGEQNEIIRILQKISSVIRLSLDGLREFREIITHVDLIQAKAQLAVDLDAGLPLIEPEGEKLDIIRGYYPLLVLKAKQTPFEVVPLNLKMDATDRIVLISGPNAGGKSVTLKTIGLLQLMLQSGFLIPVDESSVFRLFDSLFLDIGDEQSVENDLSTYTSHLFQMRRMGDRMTRGSLFLIDEFGSGTDPKQGGAIAEAFLERFVRQGAYGVITTHYGNLKEFAEITHGVMNAAMEFNTRELKPTYTLVSHMPGRSYAFEMAKRVGVHFSIIRNARKKVGTDEVEVEKLLHELEKKNQELSRLVKENAEKEKSLSELVEKHRQLSGDLEKNKKQIIREAEAQAKNIILGANRQIEQTIREIREKQAEKKATQEIRQKLEAAIPEVTPPDPEEYSVAEPSSEPKSRDKKAKKEFRIEPLPGEIPVEGDWVKLTDSNSYGKLIELQGNRGVVELGEMRLTVKTRQLIKIKPPKESKKPGAYRLIGDYTVPAGRFKIDLIGKRVEDALPEVDRYLEESRLAGLNVLRILHGKGNGILREAIRTHLTGQRLVKSIKDAPVEEGGAGWTIVELTPEK
ncbi:MAG: Smr/MutS family protein [Bacteroidia bacterium]|nr:Smr/MutS family protein [Bacteroidia bacterium]